MVGLLNEAVDSISIITVVVPAIFVSPCVHSFLSSVSVGIFVIIHKLFFLLHQVISCRVRTFPSSD